MSGKWRLWHYIKIYKFNSIFIKNLLLIMLLVVAPLIGLNIGVYNYYNNVMRDEIAIANKNALSRVRDMVDMIVRETDKLSLRIASDNDVDNFLLTAKPDVLDYDAFYRMSNIQKTIGVSTITSDYIDSIYVYSNKNDYILTSTRGSGQLQHFFDRDWHKAYIDRKKNDNFWFEVRHIKELYEGDTLHFISNFRLAPLYDQRKMGAVIINIDISKLTQLINNVSKSQFENIFIVDELGHVLYNADPSLLNKDLNDIDYLKDLSFEGEKDPIIRNVGKVKGVISLVNSEYNDWKYISITPLQQYEQKTEYLRRFMTAFMATSVGIAFGLAFFISISIFKPIENIIDIIENPEEWVRSNKLNDKAKLNEFKYIALNLIKYFDSYYQMEEELAHRISLLRKAQAIALQAQINPHFLFNTLETINWMVMGLTKGENMASDMISSLSELLRISLETGDSLVPMHVELKHARLYVDIQKVRYRDKFDVVWDIDESVLDCKIVKLTVQPLIENAIYHGIKPKRDKGTIKVRGYMQASDIILEIIDDGVGMPPEDVVALNDEMAHQYIKEDQHIGMRNVNQRIKLLFGDEYGLAVESVLGSGTRVKMLIPIVK